MEHSTVAPGWLSRLTILPGPAVERQGAIVIPIIPTIVGAFDLR
jgi:hypothetical protein